MPARNAGVNAKISTRRFRRRAVSASLGNADTRTNKRQLKNRMGWNELAVGLTEGSGRVEELTGLESWFTLPGAPLRALPKWKMALATFLGVFPTAAVLNLTLGPAIRSWPFILGNAVFNACMVALLTWVVMPLITRALYGW